MVDMRRSYQREGIWVCRYRKCIGWLLAMIEECLHCIGVGGKILGGAWKWKHCTYKRTGQRDFEKLRIVARTVAVTGELTETQVGKSTFAYIEGIISNPPQPPRDRHMSYVCHFKETVTTYVVHLFSQYLGLQAREITADDSVGAISDLIVEIQAADEVNILRPTTPTTPVSSNPTSSPTVQKSPIHFSLAKQKHASSFTTNHLPLLRKFSTYY
jgi:hypothetical protein